MLRTLFTAVCTVEVLAPQALINSAEQIALENPDDCDWRPWVVPGARFEGLAFIGMMWWSDASYATFKKFLGLIGILALLYPRAYVDYGASIAYTDESTPEWKAWVYTGTRVVGFVYVCIALSELVRQPRTDSDTST